MKDFNSFKTGSAYRSSDLPIGTLLADYFRYNDPAYIDIRDIVLQLGDSLGEAQYLKTLQDIDRLYKYKQRKLEELLKGISFRVSSSKTAEELIQSQSAKLSSYLIGKLSKFISEGNAIYNAIRRGSPEGLESISPEDLLKYCFYNDDFAGTMSLLLTSVNSDTVPGVLVFTLYELEKNSKLRDFCFAVIVNNPDHLKMSAVQAMLKTLESEQRLKLYELFPILEVQARDVAILPEETRLTVLARQNFPPAEMKKLLQAISLSRDSYCKRYASIYIKLLSSGNTESEKLALSLLPALPETKYLLSYITNFDAGPLRFCSYSLRRLIVDSNISSLPECETSVDFSALFRYFDPYYKITSSGPFLSEEYGLQMPWCPSVYYPVASIEFNNGIETTRSHIPILSNELVHGQILPVIRERFKEDIQKDLAKARNNIEEYLFKLRLEDFKRGLDRISSDMAEERIVLDGSSKADIEFQLSSFSGNDNPSCLLDMKIGLAKKYVVKDVHGFIRSFANRTTTVYGKGFTFTHLIENVDESKHRAMEVLSLYTAGGYPYNSGDKKKLLLYSDAIAGLLHALKGSSVFFGGEEYSVTLREKSCPIKIDGSMTLRTGMDDTDCRCVNAGGEIFVFNRDTKTVDLIPADKELQKVIMLAVNNSGMSIEPVFEQFRDNVYSRFYPSIEVDEAVSDRLKVSELELKAFFDFDKGMITVKTELSKDGTAVMPNSLDLPADKIRYSSYLRCLSSMGFSNNVMSNDGDVLNFFSMDMTRLKSLCSVYLSDSISAKKLRGFQKQTVQIRRESTIMQAFLEKSEYSDEELAAIIKAIRKKKRFILLSGDRIVNLSGEDALDFESTVSDLGLDINSLSEEKEISIAQALKGFAHESSCRLDDYLYQMVEEIRGFKTADIKAPALNAELRPYQLEGFKWLSVLCKYHVGGILADDMGLGKTLETIALIRSDTTKLPNLIVCPKSVVFNWINEFHRFAPELEVEEIYGSAADRQEILEGIKKNRRVTYITSYDSLRNDIELYKMRFNIAVLDEAQYIKNVDAKKSKSVKTIKAAHRFALTGTPIENSILDLWSIFDFIMPGYLEELSRFKSEYTRDSDFTALVSRRVAPFILRRTKKDVLKELPDKFERILSVEMVPEQRRLYDAFVKEAKDAMDSGSSAFDILPYLMRLRQICDEPSLFAEGYTGGSGKMNMLSELTDSYLKEGHRLLIFSQFVKGLEHVESMLSEKGLEYYKITGDTRAEDRIEMMNEFNSGKGKQLFLISLKAGGTGLNLTGADTVIHLDPWWNVAAENQASDRAHRIGQTRNVEVIRLICENSVEQRVIELQNLKKELIESLISDSDKSVTGVTLEDIAFILK